jgi:hypothetical protein
MKPYEPSNGTEGEMFMEKHCYHCKNELFIHTSNESHHKCDILTRALAWAKNEPEYPTEWVYKENQPTCTTFVKHEWFNESGELQEYEEPINDPDQLKLFEE